MLWLLHGIARSVRHGDPFVRDNVRRLRAIGVLLIVGVVGAHYLGVALQDALAEPYSRSPREPAEPPGLLPADRTSRARPAASCGLGVIRPRPGVRARRPAARRRRGDDLTMPPEPSQDSIGVHLDHLLAQRGMTLTDLADRVGVTVVNLSILKNGRARAIRFSTLAALCDALDCQPGDLLTWKPRRAAELSRAQRAQLGKRRALERRRVVAVGAAPSRPARRSARS